MLRPRLPRAADGSSFFNLGLPVLSSTRCFASAAPAVFSIGSQAPARLNEKAAIDVQTPGNGGEIRQRPCRRRKINVSPVLIWR
ncbi:hypothetical protein C2U68_12115 [Methylomonas koyamae]|nr:hypothetical protein C2U68_12115 [Methylomonas koyamae]